MKELGGQKNGRNRKESPRKEAEMVWTCDQMRGALRRKKGDGNKSTRKTGREEGIREGGWAE